jgi:hypothetical protein
LSREICFYSISLGFESSLSPNFEFAFLTINGIQNDLSNSIAIQKYCSRNCGSVNNIILGNSLTISWFDSNFFPNFTKEVQIATLDKRDKAQAALVKHEVDQ